MATNEKKDINSIDKGIGISYQFFIGKRFYIQPGFHTYLRAEKSVLFNGNETYNIPTFDKTFVIRLGVRLFSKYDK